MVKSEAVEVPNAHPLSDEGWATEPVAPGFEVANSNELCRGLSQRNPAAESGEIYQKNIRVQISLGDTPDI
jgi:hypothetical protein